MSDKEVKTIRIIPSKSFAHRAYICDFLAGENASGVICDLESDDINATRNCIASLANGVNVIDAMESGSTLRFILPLAGVLGKTVSIITRGRLSKRPMLSFEDTLIRNGMEIEHESDGIIKAKGKLRPGVFMLPGAVSSQFVTGLLLSLPYLDGDSRIELTSELKSKAYVDITKSVLADYGVSISEHDGIYEVPGGQKYSCSGGYHVEGDWSQAAFWLAAGLIGEHPVKVEGLRADSVQGDRKIVKILRDMGGRIEEEKSDSGVSYIAYPSSLHGKVIDVSEVPDLAPAIACAACAANGSTRLVNAERLMLKESNRIESIVNCACDLGFEAVGKDAEICINGTGGEAVGKDAEICIAGTGGQAVEKDTEICIAGTGGEAGSDSKEICSVRTADDHRIVMMAAVLSLISDRKVEIAGSSTVSKSYPTFFDELENAGLAGNIIR